MSSTRMTGIGYLRLMAVAAPLVIGWNTAAWLQAEPPKEFEVASIKPSTPGERRVQIEIAPGGRFVAKNVSVKILMDQAYGVKDFQISGGPGWINSDRFDINAKADDAVTPEQFGTLIQALLAERFKLVIHRETKDLPMYSLVAGKGGPKLKEVPDGGHGPQVRMGRGLINGQGMTMAMFAAQLGRQLGRSVTDKTGLSGRYDIKLEWTPDESQGSGPRDVGAETAPPLDSTGPSIFAALQEQLGLKLESQKGPVEMIVIDRLEKPTEN